MLGFGKYIAIGAMVLSLVLGGVAGWYKSRADDLSAQNVILKARVAGCAARLSQILKDKESDAEVDNLSDDDLRTVPDDWLRP